ncbi:MAG: aminodeoxychorismate lyase [Methylococcaceae bacterium]|nr:aminodeoxychorismate lyase [Methylococcaceae bacterium]
MILLNGEYKDHIEISDRGLQYGDGLFETIAVLEGQAIFWDQHWQRLHSGCVRLGIPVPDAELVKREAKRLCQDAQSAVLKIIVTRGSGGRGYRQPESIVPSRVLSLHPFPEYPHHYKELGIAARFCETRLGLNPSLAGMKHLNRLEQVLARAEWTDASIQEGIMLDINDHVIEGTMTNLFYIKNDTLNTSSIIHAGIAGIMRGIILSLWTGEGLPAVERTIAREELLSAEEVFVCNSIIGVWPVKRIEDSYFSVGPMTRQIQFWVDRLTQEARQS